MNKYDLEIDNIRKQIKKNKNPLYRQAMMACLNDLEKMLSNKGPDLPSDVSSSFDSYLTKVYENEQNKKELDILLNLFINNYSDLLKLLEIKEPLVIYCFFRVCLLSGTLSAINTFNSSTIPDNNDFPTGARLVTGTANNADINYFLVKLYQKMGINAITIPCVIMPAEFNTCIEAIRRANTDILKQTINITLVNKDNNLLVIDYLNKEFAINRDIDFFKFPSYGLLVDYSYEKNMPYESKKQLSKLLGLPLLPISEDDFISKYGKAYAIYYKQYNEIKMFNEMNKDLKKRIADYFPSNPHNEDSQKLVKKNQSNTSKMP